TPSHIIGPAIHKSREDVSELFQQKLGVPYIAEPERLAAVARQRLRAQFLQAGMGISGVNFAVAETGTVVVVENEGNARLTTSLPPVHVAVMGMEKVIPTLADLAVFLQILARSATGQKMSSYVSLLTGPRREEEPDGPEELHLVILDNGRTRIFREPELRESLYCLRCGACLNVCPVYQKVGGHAYGWVYSGPIGAVITPQLVGLHRGAALPYASSLCAACREVCPVKIDIPHLLLNLRSRIVATEQAGPVTEGGGGPSGGERILMALWAFCMRHPKLYERLLALGALLQRPFLHEGKLETLPFPFSSWTRTRDLPPLASEPFRQWWRKRAQRLHRKEG
ncbi:MAG: lactate utilization protein, partial [Nitrospinota bacterium]